MIATYILMHNLFYQLQGGIFCKAFVVIFKTFKQMYLIILLYVYLNVILNDEFLLIMECY